LIFIVVNIFFWQALFFLPFLLRFGSISVVFFPNIYWINMDFFSFLKHFYSTRVSFPFLIFYEVSKTSKKKIVFFLKLLWVERCKKLNLNNETLTKTSHRQEMGSVLWDEVFFIRRKNILIFFWHIYSIRIYIINLYIISIN
jgi:hypothetical protein